MSSGLGDIVGGITGLVTGDKASDALTSANNEYLALFQRIFDQSRDDTMPWVTRGRQGLEALAGQLGLDGTAAPNMEAFYKTPGYKFQLGQGTQAIERSQAARGMLNSGSTLQALTQFGQGLGEQSYGNYLNRLSGLSQQGQTGVGQLNALGSNYASGYGQGLLNKGDIRASEYLGQGNSIGQIAGGLFGGGGGGGGGNLLSTVAGLGAVFSDRRLKSEVQRIGTHPSGLPWYEYTIFGERQQGVMADEARERFPHAVSEHPSGYLMVDYGALNG